MNIYNAIMKAADQVERSPKQFSFNSNGASKCGSTWCALGFVCLNLGICDADYFESDELVAHGLPNLCEFLERMDSINRQDEESLHTDAITAAKVMRLYAKKYHAPTLPDSVTAIFKQSPIEVKRALEVMETQP